ncbi:hypothetical protein F3Y22_tig00111213pilonHSYRG00118 [Hibiscus syriacus]|uniref:Ubiquitin-like protease family profile domain-containing protein n=1 Tax=Hibiscus syriacus TaxID=106335 RepID=A0A6A2YVR2_HIBSY|nr:hypothetical protein F3Y22_tig00111213pilonHSYRG00118 [Hibiscus syriacus]
MLELKDHNPSASRNSKWLQTQHSRTFISWLKTKVDTHFANGEDICESVRWLAKGPSFAVMKYSSFAINEYRFHTTSQDESRTTQCSGVSLVAHAMQIASTKDSNPVYGVVTYYGRIQEIWDLDYRIFTVHVFMCDWVDSRGIKKDDFGFTVVNFARLDHQSERFILASQAKQVFYVQDQQDVNLSVVGFTPHKMYKYGVNGETDDMLEYHATFDFSQDSPLVELDDNFLCSCPDGKTTKGKVIVTYNKKGVSIGVEATKLASFEGMVARSMVPITYATWRDVEQEKKRLMAIHFEEISQKAKKLRGQHRYNHQLSRKGYAGLTLEIMQETGKEEDEIDRALLWKKARQMKKGGYDPNIQIVVDKMDTSCYLAIDIASNIVAKGPIMKHNDLSGENIEVMMEMSVQGDALLPFPLDEDFIYKVKDAVGFLVKWPRYLVIRCSDLSVKVQCEDDMFGYESFTYITWEDFEVVFTVNEMIGSGITCYMMYLFEEIKNGPKIYHGICFMSPSAISPSGRKEKFKNSDEAIRSVADQLSLRKDNDIVLVPYNPGRHWVLAVIDMKATSCYYLDSLEPTNVYQQLKQVIDAAMKLYTAQSGSNKRVILNWINVLCPRQSGGTECGYYVCKFMKEIVENGLQVLVNKNVDDEKEEYMDDDIDDIRKEWVSYVANFIVP